MELFSQFVWPSWSPISISDLQITRSSLPHPYFLMQVFRILFIVSSLQILFKNNLSFLRFSVVVNYFFRSNILNMKVIYIPFLERFSKMIVSENSCTEFCAQNSWKVPKQVFVFINLSDIVFFMGTFCFYHLTLLFWVSRNAQFLYLALL